ncbi:uncharacterized protein BDCG_16115 [Blastomyces dermatitidis ER-3]|uniref:Uncharacterized protein n=1 Tax=Ajellomyces dermatitidis (strain ER-3 / ATCC MYA-2586) TaxID=559297 RepID=A0ABX2VRJ6_AJEDR|nr:uncharacterized protein BDCG_16115 [Blastomyces dermatitidis ER-3]OAS99415.1 hypothetical protein BDCG_16115 [Blastomyces dermatitidis ER-3]
MYPLRVSNPRALVSQAKALPGGRINYSATEAVHLHGSQQPIIVSSNVRFLITGKPVVTSVKLINYIVKLKPDIHLIDDEDISDINDLNSTWLQPAKLLTTYTLSLITGNLLKFYKNATSQSERVEDY